MDLVEHLRNLFSYDDWANSEVLASLESLPTPPARSVKLLAHILSAEKLWLERLQGQKQTQAVWPDFTVAQCRSEIGELARLWKDYLASARDATLSQSFTYKNTKGESFTNQKQYVLLHVIMHSAYHRGQIAADIRAAGHTPPYTDFIHAVRQGFLKP